MNTKLTLRVDDEIVAQAKTEAKRRGKSVSQMFGEYIEGLSVGVNSGKTLPPVTSSLVGLIKDKGLDESAYKKHLLEKHQ